MSQINIIIIDLAGPIVSSGSFNTKWFTFHLFLAAYDRPEVDSGPTSNIRKQTDGLSDATGKPENSNMADDVIDEASRAEKRKITQDTQDADTKTKRRLETLLQLETHARLTVEENFQRVKGFGFVFLHCKQKKIYGSIRLHKFKKMIFKCLLVCRLTLVSVYS